MSSRRLQDVLKTNKCLLEYLNKPAGYGIQYSHQISVLIISDQLNVYHILFFQCVRGYWSTHLHKQPIKHKKAFAIRPKNADEKEEKKYNNRGNCKYFFVISKLLKCFSRLFPDFPKCLFIDILTKITNK